MSRVDVVLAVVLAVMGGVWATLPAPLSARVVGPVDVSVVRLAEARAVLDTDAAVDVLVLGDSTGNALDEWPALWAGSFAAERSVTVRQWDFNLERFAPEWSRLGGEGPGLRVWNLSQPGARADYPVTRLGRVGAAPDLVLYSFGHNNTPDDIEAGLAATVEVVAGRWGSVPGVVVLQNPSTGALAARQAETVERLREWAPVHGLGVVDVWSAFTAAGVPLGRLLMDVTHPNERGQRVWAAAVAEALG